MDAKNKKGELTLGPLLFHWAADKKRDFYFKIADEAPIGTVYLGEVVCSKRSPFFEPYYADVAERLQRAGKKIVFSSLAEVMVPRERKMTAGLCAPGDFEIEANDASSLYHLRGRPHRIGQYFNVYNEETLMKLAQNGATHIALPAELPHEAIASLGKAAQKEGVGLEVQVYGRVGLALSARCYHARAHGRTKDDCRFVCEKDPDGMLLKTLDERGFLCVNGVQTLSYACLNLVHEMCGIMESGVRFFRLSAHDCDMVGLAECFAAVLRGTMTPEEAMRRIAEKGLAAPPSNGFYHAKEGHSWTHG
jgi:collagenase-like PrtC family protease